MKYTNPMDPMASRRAIREDPGFVMGYDTKPKTHESYGKSTPQTITIKKKSIDWSPHKKWGPIENDSWNFPPGDLSHKLSTW